MVVYDARPSAFTQLTTTADWESFVSAMGGISSIDYSVGNALTPSLDTGGRNAVLADGNIAIKGMLWRCDAAVSTPIPAASAQNRIDRLVLRLTRGATTSATVVVPTVITGTPSGSPVEPPIVQTTTGIWDFPISSWTSTSAGAISGLVDEREQSPTLSPARNGLVSYKPADTSRTSTTTPTDDPDLKMGLAASAIYEVRFSMSYACSVASGVDFKFGFTVPAGATGFHNKWYWSGSTTGQYAIPDAWATVRAGNIDNTRDWGVAGQGIVFTTSAGFITFQWSQNVSNGTAVILRKGSMMIANQIG